MVFSIGSREGTGSVEVLIFLLGVTLVQITIRFVKENKAEHLLA
jgi:hypothetical protein